MYHVSQLPQLLPVVFVQPQKQTWIKEAHEKNAKMQDICNKETKTTAASLSTVHQSSVVNIFKGLTFVTTGPNIIKFHMQSPGNEAKKVYIFGPGHMTKMATMPIYDITLNYLLFQIHQANCLET